MLALLISIVTPAPALPAWLSGHWLQCSAQGEVAETWTDTRGGVMLGMSKTVRAGKAGWEHSRIGLADGGIVFHADPSGQTPVVFRAVEAGAARIVFENATHDFPQRITYERKGDALHARIEGRIDGQTRSVDWQYTLAALNAECPR
jgi:hypothetical protein